MSMIAAIRKTRDAFMCEYTDAPDITLPRHEDGIALLGECQKLNLLGPWNGRRTRAKIGLPPLPAAHLGRTPDVVWIVDTHEPQPKPYMEINIYGMKVRWPAKRMSVPGGEPIWY